MKIGIDISQIVYGTGVSVYTKNLVENLLKIDKENEYVLFGGSMRRNKELRLKSKEFEGDFESRICLMPPSLADLIWNRLHMGRIEWLTGKLDVYHSSDWTQAPSRAFKVTTVHDIVPIKFLRETDRKVVAVHRRRLKWVKREVDRIIVPSETTKQDLVELGFDEEKIRVIAEAVESFYKSQREEIVKKLRSKYRLNEEYLLMIGTGGRKNVKNIVRAFELMKEKNMQLVFTGERPRELGQVRGVRFLGYVNEGDLRALYSGARALVYTTLYEGFGLPVLQAMACGCPVVTSRVSSLPEVAGKAAVLVDPNDPGEIAEGIKKALKEREELIKKGKKRVKEFSWEKAARETLKVYLEER